MYLSPFAIAALFVWFSMSRRERRNLGKTIDTVSVGVVKAAWWTTKGLVIVGIVVALVLAVIYGGVYGAAAVMNEFSTPETRIAYFTEHPVQLMVLVFAIPGIPLVLLNTWLNKTPSASAL